MIQIESSGTFYSQQELDSARMNGIREGFENARKMYRVQVGYKYDYGDIKFHYETVEQYLSTKKPASPAASLGKGKRDWEILQLESISSGITYKYDPSFQKADYKIRSVRKISDGQIFTLGDVILYTLGETFTGQIDSFEVRGNTMIVYGSPLSFCIELKDCQKPTTNEVKDVPFVWTDELVKDYIHMAFAPCDPNHQFQEQRMKEFKEAKQKQ